MRTIETTVHAHAVPADSITTDPQPGDQLGGALFWIRAVAPGENEARLALTASGEAVFTEDMEDAWRAVFNNDDAQKEDTGPWILVVQVVGVRNADQTA